jgi:two-component system OmpR family response regulator
MNGSVSPYAVILMPDHVERDLVALTLLRLGCSAIACKDIIAAEEAINAREVDLLIIDVILPGGNGLDLIAAWKIRKNLSNCRIIVISAMRFPEFVNQAKLAGAVDFLVKPVDVEMIIQRVSKWIKK